MKANLLVRAIFLLFIIVSSLNPLAADPTTPQNPSTHTDKPFEFPFDDKELHADESDKFFGEVIKMLMTLVLLVAVMIIASWMLKRMMNARVQQLNTSSDIKVAEKRMLSNKATLYLLEVQGKSLLVGESPHGLVLLSTFRESFADVEASLKDNQRKFKIE